MKKKNERKKEKKKEKSSNGEHFTAMETLSLTRETPLSRKRGETEKRKERRYKGKCEKKKEKISPRRNSVLLAEIRC